ncbi:hypothetical protein F5Y01DRAFT_228632 [Xylaria sp. FL0043]|nr:hypothetical protein F5Y01DRAFT_228632 [Xylaria sp. FL0043]
MCSHWLGAINMPIRGLIDAINATKLSKVAVISEDEIDALDGDDEYDVYQEDDNGYLDLKTIPTGTHNHSGAHSPDQQLSSAFPPPVALMSRQDAPTAEYTEKFVTRPSKDITFVATPTKVVPQLRQEETGVLSPEVVDLATRESRLIMQLQITNERKERERLTAELLELLQKSEDLTLSAKTKQSSSSADHGDVFKASTNRGVPVPPCTEAKEWAEREPEEKSPKRGRLEATGMEENGEGNLQGDLEKTFHGNRTENEPIVRRKTPPHLRLVW